jgi:hypothetical protein
MTTLKVVNNPVISATAAPSTAKTRHTGASSNVEKRISNPN